MGSGLRGRERLPEGASSPAHRSNWHAQVRSPIIHPSPTPEPPLTSPIPTFASALDDRYRIEREIGQGGMATVYLAEDLKHRRNVAIKVVHPELSAVIGSERFLKEIELTANLQHPHILPLFDSGSANGQLFYVMPFVEGESLRDRLAREKQLPIEDAVRLAREVASALDYAHRHGVVHRDIKPENILLHDGSALVADFGIALAMQQAGSGRMTQTGMSLGTPSYMSPEQAMGEREIGPRSDVYALGAITYEMLTGEAPFTGPTAQAIVAKVMTEDPASIILRRKTVPSIVEQAVLTALQKLPADRWATAKEFSDALDGKGTQLTQRLPAYPPSRPGFHPPTRLPALLGALAALCAAAAIWGWARKPSAPPAPLARYEIRLPYFATARLSYTGGSVAVSPDGATIAYVGRKEQGVRTIWVRNRASLEARQLPGTDLADAPFFSPDGVWIAYFVNGDIWKVRVEGGAPTRVTDSANVNLPSGFWGTDGTIVYNGNAFDLRSIDTRGNTANLQVAEPVGATAWAFPAALPRIDAILATACTNNCATMAVMAIDLKTHEARELVAGAARGWYVAPGYLVYARQDGNVYAQPFDAKTFALSGAPIPLVANVRTVLGITPEMAFSDNGTLIHLDAGATQELQVVRVTRDGRHQLLDPAWQGSFNSMALSPDGRQLALSVVQTGHTDLWIKQLDRGPLTRLTFEGNINYRPVWTPDGRSVAFISDRTGRSLPYVTRADGSGSTVPLAIPDTNQVDEIVYSRDGRWIIYRVGVTAGVRRLMKYHVGDSASIAIEPGRFDQYMPALSPDGRWLAYVTVESGREEVYVRPFPNTDDARWQVSSAGGSSPMWARAGRELVFADTANRVVSTAIAPGDAFAAGPPVPLFILESLVLPPFHQGFGVGADGADFIFFEDRASSDKQGRYAVLTLSWLDGLGKASREQDNR